MLVDHMAENVGIGVLRESRQPEADKKNGHKKALSHSVLVHGFAQKMVMTENGAKLQPLSKEDYPHL